MILTMIYTMIAILSGTVYFYPELFNKYIMPIIKKVLILLQMFVCKLSAIVYPNLVTFGKNYLIDVITDEQLNNTIQFTLQRQLNILLTDEKLNEQLMTTVKNHIEKISTDPEIYEHVHEIVQKNLESTDSHPRTRAAVANIMKTQIDGLSKQEWFEKELKENITNIVVNTCESVEVKDKLRELLEKLSGDLIQSGEIEKRLNDLLTQVVNNEEFLQNTGSGIRRSLRHAAYGLFWTSKDETEIKEQKESTTSNKTESSKTEKISEGFQTSKPVEKLKVSIVTKPRSGSVNSSGNNTSNKKDEV